MERIVDENSISGSLITQKNKEFIIPNDPIIPFIEGDGIGVDITPVMISVVNAAVAQAYNGTKHINWLEIYCGEKAVAQYNDPSGMPDETIELLQKYKVSIKGPLTTPVGGGFRSLNVALRQILDLFLCQRPVRWYEGVPSPVKHPEYVDMTIFRENSEDIYAGIEWQADSQEAKKIIDFLQNELNVKTIRFPEHCGIGIKPISENGTKRLVREAIEFAIQQDKPVVTLVHKGNIMKFTEGAFKDWGYQVALEEYNGELIDGGPWVSITNPTTGKKIVINDVIADAFLQQILTRPKDYSVVATMNLNGDYISDALAAQIGGIGIAPGANIGESVALFEATHGTAPKYQGQDKVNPSSLILSAEMMLRFMQWNEAADLIVKGMTGAIGQGKVTYDLARLMEGATELKCSEFGKAIIANMK